MSLADDLNEILRQEERWELIYEKIDGLYIPIILEEEGIKDELSAGGVLGLLHRQIYQARNRIAGRLGIDPNRDRDFDQLIDGFEAFSRTCGKLMYQYGYRDGANGYQAETDGK